MNSNIYIYDFYEVEILSKTKKKGHHDTLWINPYTANVEYRVSSLYCQQMADGI
jgi:hypothetical protein